MTSSMRSGAASIASQRVTTLEKNYDFIKNYGQFNKKFRVTPTSTFSNGWSSRGDVVAQHFLHRIGAPNLNHDRLPALPRIIFTK